MRHYLLAALLLLSSTTDIVAQSRVSVHDPSVVDAGGTYYIFGSHQAWAKTTDLFNWTEVPVNWGNGTSAQINCSQAFSTNQTTTVTIGGQQKTFGNFDVKAWSAGGDSSYDISGNLWAPDVIWNPTMQKWCMYLSINGVNANCSIVLLTADNIEGPYVYQGPVVFSGFYDKNNANLSYKKTDLELVIGQQSSLPARYDVGSLNGWRHRWPNCIDPCVFYDEQGKLWMSYGSWHGGIFMLQLDETTGLRDYDVTYPLTVGSNADHVTSDPYYGTKIAGGFQVSGEASYIKHIGSYYYLFITYGGLEANGGYQMRVFRSENPDGPYTDSYHNGGVAIYDAARVNYGPDGTRKTDRGENIFGAYGEWGYQAVGDWSERSQGHNSVLVKDGRSYLVYHTRFQNLGEWHQVRVHQMWLNQDGWLCAAPFEYKGETITDSYIASTQKYSNAEIAGNYKLLVQTYNLDHKNKQLSLPVMVKLNADGTITGDATGTWQTVSGTSYINLTVGDISYKGVVVEQTIDGNGNTEKTIAFSAYAGSKGYTVWGYKVEIEEGLVGTTNNTTAYLGAHSDVLQLTSGKEAVFEFTNYSSKQENWHNFVTCVMQGSTFNSNNMLIALRADRWENVQFSEAGITCNYDWDTFRTDMDGSTVKVVVKYQNGSVAIRADITTATGKHLYEEFSKSGISGTICTSMSVEKAHLIMTRAEVRDVTAINAIETRASLPTARYDLQGRRVDADYKGIVIENGRKRISR